MITFDRWHAGFLGCFGNPWVDTPHLDQLAVRGTTFDQHFAEDLSPRSVQHAWWTGRYEFPLDPDRQAQEPAWLPWLMASDIQTTLLHDPQASTPIPIKQFSTARAVPLDEVPGLHHEEDTPKFVRAAISRLKQMAQSPEQRQLLWIHAGGIPVDATSLAYDELYADDAPRQPVDADAKSDDDGAETPAFPPRFWRRNRASPRELAGAQLRGTGWQGTGTDQSAIDWQRRRDLYLGQVTQWDTWIGQILQAVTELRKQTDVLLIFTAAAGEQLGEHAGHETSADLFEEQIHVPLIMEMPQDESYSGRRHQLTQSVDLPATLLDWFQVSVPPNVRLDGHSLLPVIREDQPLPRAAAFVGDSVLTGVRTADFYFRQSRQPDLLEPREQIFLKPDDRWDADNMLRQYIDSADELSGQARAFIAAIRERGPLTN